MVGHGGSSAGSYLADPTSPIPSHCASIVVTSTLRVKACLHCLGYTWHGPFCSLGAPNLARNCLQDAYCKSEDLNFPWIDNRFISSLASWDTFDWSPHYKVFISPSLWHKCLLQVWRLQFPADRQQWISLASWRDALFICLSSGDVQIFIRLFWVFAYLLIRTGVTNFFALHIYIYLRQGGCVFGSIGWFVKLCSSVCLYVC